LEKHLSYFFLLTNVSGFNYRMKMHWSNIASERKVQKRLIHEEDERVKQLPKESS